MNNRGKSYHCFDSHEPQFDIHLTILRNLTGSTIAIITSKDFENGSTEIEVTPISVKAEFSIHDNQSNAYINNNNYYWVDNTFYNQHKHQLGLLEKTDDCISISLLTTLDENIKQLAILLLLSSVIYQERSTRTKKFKWPTIKHKPLAKVG